METKSRSLIKALSYRVIGTGVTALLVYFVTGQATLSFAVGLFDSAVKILVYFLHERAWSRIQFGRVDQQPVTSPAPAATVEEAYVSVDNPAVSVN